jgi:gamma-glutamylcyclotransferase
MAAAPAKTEPNRADGVVFHGKLNELYFFAYGSNMNQEQIVSRGARPVVIGVGKLPHHRLVFHGYSRIWDGGLETVVSAPGQEVWGVIYKLTVADWDRLDSWQDVRLDGTGTYFHFPDRVKDTEGKTHLVLLYKKDILREPQPPSREYLDVIVQGAVGRGLPAGYIEELRRLEARPAAFDVPRQGKFSPELLLGASCSGCED